MATTVIDRNEARVPFFGDKMSFITGLDPLGLQNPSGKTYSFLLPGLNNVTWQIRAYSFYCWLLDEYSKKIQSTDPKEQKQFIRKAEYIIALLSSIDEIPGISGQQYARAQIETKDTFNLNTGTYNSDGSTDGTYWQYGFGVFGQYYVGSMRQIGIIDEPINEKGEFLGIYRKTSAQEKLIVSGESLAEAFDETLKKEAKLLFLNCIEKASITMDEIQSLIPYFNLRKLSKQTKEWELLKELLLSNDEPLSQNEETSRMRRKTLFHVLKFASDNPGVITDREFTIYAYKNQGIHLNEKDSCLTGWYYYQLNEYWQFACTGIFNGCLTHLESLKGPGWMPLMELIDISCDHILKNLDGNDNIRLGSTINTSSISVDYSENELYSLIRKGNDIDKMSYGLLLILKVYANNRENLSYLNDYVNSHNLTTSYDGLKFFIDFKNQKEQPIEKFIKGFLYENIIQRHQIVAYRKMGSGNQSTQKFIIEDGLIRQIGNFSPVYTGPRVGNLITFLKDLHFISEDGKITDDGRNLIIDKVN